MVRSDPVLRTDLAPYGFFVAAGFGGVRATGPEMRLEVVYFEHRHGLLLTLTWPLATRTEGYSSGGVRARGPVLSPLSLHILQNRPVEIAAPLLALLEVLGADVGAQSVEEIVVLDILTLDVPAAT